MADPRFHWLGAAGSEQAMSNNDATFDYLPEIQANEVWTAGAVLKRYEKGQRGHWQWAYTYLFGRKRDVYDGGMGYYDLLALWELDSSLSYIIPRQDQSQGMKSYTVAFALGSWRARRVYISGDREAWSLNFELVQVS